jgi:filamentous hemagglutinin family protein
MILDKYCTVLAGFLLLWVAPLAYPVSASVQEDGTTGTQVVSDRQQQIYNILNGTQIDQNLLHSFLNFSVENGWTAAFRLLPGSNVTNIIARITGSNVSNIDGLLSADRIGHPVNLFLINPNGIIFGSGAKLDLSGSFLASTADSVKFSESYTFSAKNPTALPSTLLTIGVPVGLQFGTAPAPIAGNLTEPGSNLTVDQGQTLALIGGDINLQGNLLGDTSLPSFLNAPSGRIEIGSVGAGETVGIKELSPSSGIVLNFSGVQRFQDISISNRLLVFGDIGIELYGREIQLNRSQIGGASSPDNRNSFITAKASELLDLFSSDIVSLTVSSVPAGSIDIQAKVLRLSTASTISADTFDVGDSNSMPGLAGNIFIKAGQVLLTDNSSITSSTSTTIAPSQAGNLSIATDALILRNQSKISTSSIFAGNGGNIAINAGIIAAVPSEDSNISTDASQGNGGRIAITTQGLFGIYPNTENFPSSSDITARSQFGVNGTVDANILTTNSVVNFATLPVALNQRILETACFGNRRSDRDSFIFSGRGGLPATPSDPAQSSAVWQDLRPTPSQSAQEKDGDRQPSNPSPQSTLPSAPIVEAQGWVLGPHGSVRLVANSANPISSHPCQGIQGATSAKPL